MDFQEEGSATRARVLILPSWYPTPAGPLLGSFFEEQARLMNERFDCRVLYGVPSFIGRRLAARQPWKIPKPATSRLDRLTDSGSDKGPRTRTFEYRHFSLRSERYIAGAIRRYGAALQDWHAEGWLPHLIHAQSCFDAGIIAAALARMLKVPLLIVEHQVFSLSDRPAWKQRLIRAAIEEAQVVAVVSNHQYRSLYLQGITRPMRIVGNLIDETLYQLTPPPVPAPFRLLSVTYPVPIKDCETLFRAVRAVVLRGHTDVRLTVIGNASSNDVSKADVTEYRRLAATFSIEAYCEFIPYAARAEMPRHYSDCHVFISTSIAETFGIAPREAMTVGRPVIATSSGGVDDILSELNGVKVNIGDFEAIADAVVALKTGARVYKATVIRESVVKRHGRDAFLRETSALYREVAGDNCRCETFVPFPLAH